MPSERCCAVPANAKEPPLVSVLPPQSGIFSSNATLAPAAPAASAAQ